MMHLIWMTTANYRQALIRCDTVDELNAAFIQWDIYRKEQFDYSDIVEVLAVLEASDDSEEV